MDTDDQHPGAQDGHEPVGSLADEATRLFGALGDWARDHGDPRSQDEVAPAGPGSPRDDPGAATECTWCPVCRTMHAIRHTSPEVRDQLLVAATSLMQAGAGLLAALQASSAERAQGSQGAQGAPRSSRPAPGGRVERIDLDDAPGDGPGEA